MLTRRARTRELRELDVFLNRTRNHTVQVLNSVLWLRNAKALAVRRSVPPAGAVTKRGRAGAALQAMPRS